MGSDNNDQLRLVLLKRTAPKERAQDGNGSEKGKLREDLPDVLPQKTRNGKALTIRQLDGGRGPSRRNSGHHEPFQKHRSRKIDLRDLRRDINADLVLAQNRWRERQSYPEGLVVDGNGPQPLWHRYGELAPRQEIGRLPAQGDECRFSQNLYQPILPQGVDEAGPRGVALGDPEERIDRRRNKNTVRGTGSEKVCLTLAHQLGQAIEQADAKIIFPEDVHIEPQPFHQAPRHLGHSHLQHDLVDTGYLNHIDHLALRSICPRQSKGL